MIEVLSRFFDRLAHILNFVEQIAPERRAVA